MISRYKVGLSGFFFCEAQQSMGIFLLGFTKRRSAQPTLYIGESSMDFKHSEGKRKI